MDSKWGSPLFRRVTALLGALGLLGLAKDLLEWQERIGRWIDAWRAVSHAIADTLLGWLVELLPFSLPSWWQDYFVMGLIVAGASFRLAMVQEHWRNEVARVVPKPNLLANLWRMVTSTLFLAMTWPIVMVTLVSFDPRFMRRMRGCYSRTIRKRERRTASRTVGLHQLADMRRRSKEGPISLSLFYESFLLAGIAIAVNYALLWGGKV